MTRIFMGTIDGRPVLKVTRNDADAPWEVPNSDWHRFAFNSDVQEIGYVNKVYAQAFSNAGMSFGTPGNFQWQYYPEGSGNADAQWARRAHISSGTRWVAYLIWMERLFDRHNCFYRFVLDNTNMPDASYEWRAVWARRNAAYPSSSDRYNLSAREMPLNAVNPRYNAGTGQWSSVENAAGLTATIFYPTAPNNAFHQSNSPGFAIYQLDLPVDESPYPTVVGTPLAGKKILSITPTEAKLAKPGFDVRTATDDQLIFSETKIPLKVIKTGFFSIAAGGQVTVPLGAAYANDVLIDYQVNRAGEPLYVPPLPEGTGDEQFLIEYKIAGSNLIFRNAGTLAMEVRYFVMAADSLEPSVGTAKVLEKSGGHFVLRRPGSAGTRLRDTIIDTRFPTMPIVAQGYVPFADMVASGRPYLGLRMHTVNFANSGWKPYVMAKLKRVSKTDPNDFIFTELWAKAPKPYDYLSDSSFVCKLTDTAATFYCSSGARSEDVYRVSGTYNIIPATHNTVGFRYYIFAVPASL